MSSTWSATPLQAVQRLVSWRYSAVSPEFCIARSTSTHRRTNSSGVSVSCVGDGSDDVEVGVEVGGSADEEESSLHEDSASRPQHVRAARKRFTTRTSRDQATVTPDASPNSRSRKRWTPVLWTT